MRLPLKVNIPEFKTYDGTTDPQHHLRHYRGKILQYWDYEEFVIHSFQDSLIGLALDWFMSLKAEDISTWADLSRKFIDQYQYCAEAPRTLLELSMKEIAQDQKFEDYATKWRAQAVKHVPPISEVQQIQLFHSTLRGVYYSHLLANTSSFSDLIEAGKKHDMGIKLGRMEGPTNKGEGEPSRKTITGASSTGGRKSKETAVNIVNLGHSGVQLYSVNFAPTPRTTPLLVGDKIILVVPAPSFNPAAQNQDLRCEYHQGASGHTTKNYWKLRDKIQDMINENKIMFNAMKSPNVQTNPFPNHASSSGPTINLVDVCAQDADEYKEEESSST
ncbi:hypothetical protein CRG98_014125 [Punica granatum]|uniref:Retrotransposon gag domain-containing protein n=1 Tax=Punica granatum TaxID=22663 RepID=A0A2I0KAA8_PUNGR|nr:hypothetical protein CRG98_014125 [Punica granatum]